MRKILVTAIGVLIGIGSASAADLGGSYRGSLKDGPVADRQFSWTGFYVGAHAGYAWGDASVTDTTGGVTPGPFSYKPDGFFGGGTVGYNRQIDRIVLGIEGDLGYMDLTGHGLAPSSNPAFRQNLTLEGGLYGDITGRLGFTFDRFLVYGKGGWGYFDGSAAQTTTKPGYVTHATGAFSGAVYGGGIEYLISPGVSIKAEYLHFNFGSQGGDQTSTGDPPIGFVYKNRTDLDADTVKLGVNYKFN